MALDTGGLRPLDTTGLRKAEDESSTSLNLEGLQPLDTSGLRPAERPSPTTSARTEPEQPEANQPAETPRIQSMRQRLKELEEEKAETLRTLEGAPDEARQRAAEMADADIARVRSRLDEAVSTTQARADTGRGLLSNTSRRMVDRASDLAGNLATGIGKAAEAGGDAMTGLTGINPGVTWNEGGVDFHLRMPEDVNDIGDALQTGGQQIAEFDAGYVPNFTWENLKGDLSVENLAGYIIEQGGGSIPDMIAAVTMLPAYIGSRTEEVATERATNDQREEASAGDYAVAAPTALAMSVLERLGAKGILGTAEVRTASQLVKEAGKAAVKEASTEAVQESMEYAATTAGTETGFDAATMVDRAAAGAVAGGGIGAAGRLATGTAEIMDKPAPGFEAQSNEPQGVTFDDWQDVSGVPEGSVSADVLFGQEVQPEGVREQAVSQVTPTSEGDIESPIPTDLIQEGKVAVQDAAGSQAASDLLEQAGFPPVETPVTLSLRDGRQVNGTLVDAFSQDGRQGAKIRLEDGRVVSGTFEQLRGRVTVAMPSEGEAAETDIEQIDQEAQPPAAAEQDTNLVHTMPDGSTMAGPEHEGAVPGSTQTMDQAVDEEQSAAPTAPAETTAQPEPQQQAPREIAPGRRMEVREEGGVHTLDITNEAGENVGRFVGEESPNQGRMRMQRQDLAEGERGQGIAVAAMLEMASRAQSKGMSLASDVSVSPDAARVYEALERRGATVVTNPHTINPRTSNLVSEDPRVPVFEVTEVGQGSQQAKAERQPAETQEQAPARAPVARRDVADGEDTAVTPSGREIPVRYAVVEAADLVASQQDDGRVNPDYPADLQPRDRSRAVSQQQIQDIAQRLNPRLVDRSPRASDGAPIVDDGGVVESGNGRVLAIRRAYSEGLDSAEQYRDYLAQQGYPVDGVEQPVLVRVREGDMTPADRAAFTREANERDTLGMSATERAMADATALPDQTLELYRGGDVDAAANRQFVRGFIEAVVGKNEQAGMISADGSMSQEAIRRIEGALLAKAYGDADLVASLIESADTNIKAIGGALMDVAPLWAQMRADAQSGQIDPGMDQTDRLLEAVRLVQRARREGRNVAEYVAQTDLLSGDAMHPVAEAFLRLMFRNTQSWTQPVGREKLAEALRFYVAESERALPGADLLGDTLTSDRILTTAKERQYGPEQAATQQDLLAQPAGRPGERDRQASGERDQQSEPRTEAPRSPEAARAGEEGTGTQQEGLILKNDGTAFKTRQSALLAARNKRGTFETVKVDGGWALREASPAAQNLRGERIDDEWVRFSPESGTLGIPRAEMPQIKAEHRGALANFLSARGIPGTEEMVQASSLKPTQAEFSEEKVRRAKSFTGGDRAILISSEGHVVDGHHQWIAKVDQGEDLRVIRLEAPIQTVLEEVREFPSVEQDGGQQEAATDRRDEQQRDVYSQRIEDMTPAELRAYIDELRSEVLTDERTGLGSNKAWLRREPKAFVASIDLDSLKWVNDNMGHDAGDRMIAAVGDAMREAGIAADSFHVSGDEFYAQADSEQALRDAMARARAYLDGVTIEGDGLAYTGPGFSYGIGTTIEQAETALHDDKASRETEGSRTARGERPRGVADLDQAQEPEPVAADRAPAPEDRQGARSERPQPDVRTEADRPASYGQSNTVFTEDAAQKARELLRRKMRGQLSSGLDPEMVQAGITLAGYHIEAGARTFAAYSRAMVEDLGEAVRPYLRSWYEGVRYHPGFDAEGMSTAEEIETTLREEQTDAERTDTAAQRDGRADEAGADQEGAGDEGRGEVGRGSTGARTQAGEAEGRPDAAVGDRGAAPDRERGDQPVPSPKSRMEQSAARDPDPTGSLPNSTGGLFAERETGQEPGRVADQAPAGKPRVTTGKRASTAAADVAEIKRQMPFLTDGQAEDVAFAERRFAKPDGFGVLFTNGTGTGKTFSGMGVVKRMTLEGKNNILIAVPKQTIADAWIRAGRDFFDLQVNRLESTQDAGSGIVVTTYANLADNNAVINRDWDAVLADETHYLSSSSSGGNTEALNRLRAMTLKRGTAMDRVRAQNPDMVERIEELNSTIKVYSNSDNQQMWQQVPRMEEELNKLNRRLDELAEAERQRIEGMEDAKKPRAVFLSATPFAYEKSVKWANEFLFDWGTEKNGLSYNAGGNYEQFMMQHFGYRMRYNRLTEPEAEVDRGLMQRSFNTWLQKEGVLSSRSLDSDYDYDRLFVFSDSALGRRVDEAIEWLNKRSSDDTDKVLQEGFEDLRRNMVDDRFDYHTRMYFLEAIKAREFLPHIRAHLDRGRKVVVLHDFKKGGTSNPFRMDPAGFGRNDKADAMRRAYEAFSREFSDLVESFDYLPSPITTLTQEFPGALVYNGDVSAKNRVKMQDDFNRDDPDSPRLMIAQSDAMREGVSIHDTTGTYPRVEINLGMPTKPTAAIQLEGRIYRTGQASDAMFRYLTIGSNWERYAFASRIASRASAAENLAMGEAARGLKEAFIEAYENADNYLPGFEGEGQGGRERDNAFTKQLTPWDMAKSFYFGTKRQGKGRAAKGREGLDYFATPEPLGLKMVQWADIRGGEKTLEPSAGHGAIARWLPENSENRAIELDRELASRVALHFDGDLMTGDFMAHNVVNKYDAIVMNPPFGQGGKQAAEHVDKATRHLRDGGRIVALVPTGPMADKRFEALLEEAGERNIYLAADIKLPTVTFERAGTSVAGRVLVLERQDNAERAAQINQSNRDYTGAETIGEFFDRLETSEIAPRVKPDKGEPEKAKTASVGAMDTWETKHTKTGEDVYMARPTARLEREEYLKAQSIAKQNNGYWSRFGKPGFLFKSAEDRQAFVDAVSGDTEGQFALREDQTQTEAFKRWFGDSKVVDENGEPLVVYHATYNDFTEFDPGRKGSHFGSIEQATHRIDDAESQQFIPAYLSINNPKRVKDTNAWGRQIREAKEEGYDGIVYLNRVEGVDVSEMEGYSSYQLQMMSDAEFKRRFGGADSWIAFSPEQIKSAIGNTGAFDPANPDIRFALTDQFVDANEKVTADLQARLKQLGIADKVALNLRDQIQAVADGKASAADGRYLNRTIEVALNARDSTRALNHEAIHALRDLGVIRSAEWRTLERAAKADTDLMDTMRSRYGRLNLSEDLLVEEAVAEMYADWAQGKSQTGGFMRRAFERIRDFLKALGRVLRGRGYNTMDSVFRSVERGDVGRRQPRDEKGRFTSERFALANPEQVSDPTAAGGQQARQRGMLQWIAGSQPLDQAMRLPFHVFGGVNERGEWKWGQKLSGLTANLIQNATFSEEGRFAWINPALHKARVGLLDRYELDPAYVERERQRGLDERRITAQVPEIMEKLAGAGVGANEARVLQAVLTGEAVADEEMAQLSEPIRNAIDDMGAEAVQLGLLSAESFERNRGAYLHRVYEKHEGDQNSLARWVSRMAGRRRKKIIGEQFKGRGMWIEVDPGRIMQRIPGFREGRRGGPVEGEQFRVMDLVEGADQGTLRDIDPSSRRRVLNRIYLPPDAPAPTNLTGYVDRGLWQVRGKKGGKTVLWRDFTKAERESMGEITDARYTIAKTYMLMANDLANGRFFRDIAMNDDWSMKQEPRAGTWKNTSEYNRFWADPAIEWVKVPDANIPGTQTKRYAALAGRFVRAEIWRDMAEIEAMQTPGFWSKLLTQWKLNKTARNPVVHMNNVVSNAVLMDLADVRLADLVAGIRAMVKQDQDYQEAVDNGAFGSDMISQEIRENVLKPILEEIQRDVQGGQDTLETKLGVVGKLADAIWSRAKNLDRKMMDLYRLEDEVFRMATYMRNRHRGLNPTDAALDARDQFLNYDIRAPWVNAARRSILPFIAYTYRAVPVVANSVALRPWKLAKYATIAYVINALGYMLSEGDEDEERRSLRDQEQGYTWIGAPRMIRMPWSDEYGNPVFLDIRRWIPAGDVFDMNQGHSALPIPAPLQFGGPLMLAGELMLNKQAFTGEPIVNDLTADWWDRTSAVGDWAWKSWMPSAPWMPGGWYWERIGNAMTGARDWQGRPYSIPQAIASSIGVKLKAQDVEESFFWKGVEFDQVERELKSQMRRLSRDHQRGLLSRSAMESRQARLLDKLNDLAEKRRKTFEGER